MPRRPLTAQVLSDQDACVKRVVLLVGSLLLGACAPTLEGPQLTKPLPGLAYVVQQGPSNPRKLGTHSPGLQRFWMTMREPHSSLDILEVEGNVTRAEVQTWLAENPSPSYAERGPLEDARIDGRAGWTWVEKSQGSRTLGAVVPYADASYVIHLYSSQAEYQDEAKLMAAVASFDRNPGGSLRVVIPVVVLALLGVGVYGFLRWKAPPPPPQVVSRPVPSPRPQAPRRPSA
jgi:hypothetical protein